MRKIAIILDGQSAKDFRDSNIDIIGIDSDTEAGERLVEIIGKKEFELIIISRDLIGGLPMDIKKIMEESKDPLLIPINIDRDEPADLKKNREELGQMVYRAIGAQLRGGERK